MNREEARAKVKRLLKEKGADAVEVRSCWNCNGAHDHLKTHELIKCYECGRWYYKGIDVTEAGEGE